MKVSHLFAILCLSPGLAKEWGMTATPLENGSHLNEPLLFATQQQRDSSYKWNTLLQTSVDSFNSSNSSCVVNVSGSCPFWSYCDEDDRTCKCFNNADMIFICDQRGNRKFILDCYCLTYSKSRNNTEVGICMFNCDYSGKGTQDVDSAYSTLPHDMEDLNAYMCGRYNRSGILCGECEPGMYIRPYSYILSCTSCSDVWASLFKYFLQAYVPLTIFYLVVLMLKINIPASSILGYVFFCQVLGSPIFLRTMLFYLNGETDRIIYKLVQLFSTLYGIWNLDFFRTYDFDICFPVNSLATFSLDFAIALYPILLMIITYALIVAYDFNFKPLHLALKSFKSILDIFRSNWDLKTSTVDAFSTFIFLSNSKFLSVCFDLLAFVKVCETSEDGNCHLALFYNPNIPYFGPQHLPYGIFAIIVLFIFVICPILILILFPLQVFHKCLILLPGRWKIVLHVFVDSYQGCFKDGTEPGSRDCRWFSAVPFIVRLLIFITYGATPLSSFYPLCDIILVLTASLLIILDPFKPAYKNLSFHFVIYILFLASVITCNRGLQNTEVVTAVFYGVIIIILTINVVYISALMFHWIAHHKKFDWKLLLTCFKRNGNVV